MFDVLLSSVLLLITLPVVALTAILIILENPGPIFSRQRRIGEFGRPFALLRFRSTFARTKPEGSASETPVRFTGVGAVIHRLCIDELPQLLNILRGEMSFVGPRPERPALVKNIFRRIAYYPLTGLFVLPDLSGNGSDRIRPEPVVFRGTRYPDVVRDLPPEQ